MAKRGELSSTQLEEIKNARKRNKDKNIEKRLHALQLYAEGEKIIVISEITGFFRSHINKLVNKYKKDGIEAITGNNYRGNNRLLSEAEEAELLAPFIADAEAGRLVSVNEIKGAYEQKIGRELNSNGHIYQVLKRHGFRKVMPRSQHPNKASDEVIHTSKKLKLNARN